MMPSDEYLAEYYGNYYQPGDRRLTVGRPSRLAIHIATMLPDIASNRISILDFGGGDGSLAKMLARLLHEKDSERSFSLTLVDFNLEPDEETDLYSFRHECDLSRLAPGSSDVVLASAIVEHVPRAHEALRDLLGLLREGGVFYARTPFVTPLKQVFRSYPLQYPMHVHDLGPAFWNRVCARYPSSLEVLVSQPSMVATGFSRRQILRTCSAYALKLPAHLEGWLRGSPTDYLWQWVGGWEVLLRRPRSE